MSKNLVIVESPAKAKTIEKYLGADYKVLASVGHIRKDVKVDVHDNFAVTYEIDPDHKNIISELKKEAKKAESIWLATDEDREGESISWHLLEVLKLPKSTHRITFHEITKTALQSAIANPRTVDMDMVSSQQARQTSKKNVKLKNFPPNQLLKLQASSPIKPPIFPTRIRLKFLMQAWRNPLFKLQMRLKIFFLN